MKYYPIYLNLKDHGVLVVGGGAVAHQKVKTLLESEAVIRVVAPEAIPELQALAEQGTIHWDRRAYHLDDLSNTRLVFAATDDAELQKKIVQQARARNIWINVVDVPPLCDFIAPAVMSRGDLQVAVSTGGASPALAKFVRQKLEAQFGPEYGALTALLQRHRPEILKLPKDKRDALWQRVVTERFLETLKTEGAAAENQLKEWIYGNTAV